MEKTTMSGEHGNPHVMKLEKATVSSAHTFINLGKQKRDEL